MPLTVDAIYENGVLRPIQPLSLREHEAVRVTIQPSESPVKDPFEDVIGTCEGPPDGAANHDKYLYGNGRS